MSLSASNKVVSKQDQGGFSQFVDIKQTLAFFILEQNNKFLITPLFIIIIIIPHGHSLHLFNVNLLILKSLIPLVEMTKHGRKINSLIRFSNISV